MTDFNKIFLDTAPFIYFLDSDINFGEKLEIFSLRYWHKINKWHHL